MTRIVGRLRGERGQSLAILAVFAIGFVGLLALVLDVGSWYRDQRHVRSVADSAALAGAQDLPNQSAASSSATSYASQNGGSLTSVSFPDAVTISVTAAHDAQTFFAKAFGIGSVHVTQSATARLIAATTVERARPFVFSAGNRYLSGSACGHTGQACLGSAYTSTFSLGSGESEEGEEQDGFGLACLNAPDCPRSRGDDSTFQPSGTNSTLSASDEEGGVNCLTGTWTGWVRDGYPGSLSIPADYPRCRGESETKPLCDSGETRGQRYLWNYTTLPGDSGKCNNQNAIGSLNGTCFFVLVVGHHGDEEGDDSRFGGSSASDEEDEGNYNAVGWARFCMTGAPVFGGSGEEGADNSMTGYFDAFEVGGPPVGCIPGPTSCFYGVGTVALSQ